MSSLVKSLGTNWKLTQPWVLWTTFFYCYWRICRWGKWLCWKYWPSFYKIKSGRATLVKESTFKSYKSGISVCLVGFEKLEWLLMTSAVIYNSFTLAKHFSSKILISNELLGMDILIPLAILSCLSAREKFVIYIISLTK